MRIGLVGVGAWGRNVLRDLLSLECEVTAVGRSESSRAAALDGGATAWVDRLDDIPPVDGVVVVVPVSVHAEVLDQVLTARDVPVFVEKPLTCDPRSARRLADRGRDRLFVMDKWRYHPGVEALRDLGRAGDIGPVQGLRPPGSNGGAPITTSTGCGSWLRTTCRWPWRSWVASPSLGRPWPIGPKQERPWWACWDFARG